MIVVDEYDVDIDDDEDDYDDGEPKLELNLEGFYNYCKDKMALTTNKEVENILYNTTAKISDNKFDTGTCFKEIWIKENDDKFIRRNKEYNPRDKRKKKEL